MGGYWSYYAAMVLMSYVLHYPPLLVGIIAFFALRSWIPDPWVLLQTWGRMSALQREIDANPHNVTARRDLAVIYLQRRRPGAALTLIEEALGRFTQDAGLLYLKGLALCARREWAKALEPLRAAVAVDPRVHLGEPYLRMGDCLLALGRAEEAIEALERYCEENASSIEAHYKLSRARAQAGRTADARGALDEAFAIWRQIPSYKRRQQLGWWLRAHVARLRT